MADITPVLRLWWPLAFTWFCLSFESIALAAIVARMPNGTVELAAFGSIAYPVTIFLEASTFQLLSASATLCGDQASYRTLLRYALVVGGGCAALQVLAVIPAVYTALVGGLIAPPESVQNAAWPAVCALAGSSIFVAVRRFHQGVLVRAGKSRLVSMGTGVRLAAELIPLGLIAHFALLPGALAAGICCQLAMFVEAVYATVIARQTVPSLPASSTTGARMGFRKFLGFYTPLASSSILLCAAQPLGSAVMAHGELPFASLVIWPAISTVLGSIRSLAQPLTEVIVSLRHTGIPLRTFRRAASVIAAGQTVVTLFLALPFGTELAFHRGAGLPHDLLALAQQTVFCGLLTPSLGSLVAYHQGNLLFDRKTSAISASVVCYLVAYAGAAWCATALLHLPGATACMLALTLALGVQGVALARMQTPSDGTSKTGGSSAAPTPTQTVTRS